MVQTYSNDKKIYSVDMMIAYLNIYKQPTIKVPISKLLHVLEYEGWGDPLKKIKYSAMDVIKSPKKYKNEINRIKKADLKYPIIMDEQYIIDGVHRLSKAYLQNKKYIKAYIFDKKLMKKFLINSKGDWKKVDKLQMHDFIKLFYEKFC